MKIFFILTHLFFFAWINAQEEENVIDEVIVSDQKNIYTMLAKVKKAFDENITYSKIYAVQLQVDNKIGDNWINFSDALSIDSLCTQNIWKKMLRNPIFQNHPMDYELIQENITPCYGPLSFRDNRYFIAPNKRQYILSLSSNIQTYIIRFQSKYYTGKLIIDKATYYPIRFEKQLIQPYNQNLIIGLTSKDLNYFQQEYNQIVYFKADAQGKLYINSYTEKERVDPFIYKIDKKPKEEYDLSFKSNFYIQLEE